MWKRILLSIGIIIIGVHVLFQAGYYLTSRPGFCAKCHEVDRYVSSWQAAAHKNYNCLDCHQTRGELGKIYTKARGLNYTLQHLSGNYTVPTKAFIPEGNCIACHLGDIKNAPDAPVLTNTSKINHFEVIKKNQSCLDCHRNTGHETDIYLTPNFQKTWK
ncbi:MAG: NapC/NirT family cytochrome c [Desulfitobacterium hafniense]|nr:NapC/NirT family cytochrome c [Desulfitobacterium hafniense]